MSELPVDVVEGERLIFMGQHLWQWLVHSQHLLIGVDYLTTAPEGGGVRHHHCRQRFGLGSEASLTGQAPSQPVLR